MRQFGQRLLKGAVMKHWFFGSKHERRVKIYFTDLGERAPELYISRYECEGQVILSGFDSRTHPLTAESRFNADIKRMAQFGIRLPLAITLHRCEDAQ